MIDAALLEHQRLFANLHSIQADIEAGYQLLRGCLEAGNKIMLCGNGGSAADCQHFAAELVGKWKAPRKPLAAIALTTDTSALTAIGNDYGYQHVFRRQVSALGRAGDVLVAISTSGHSTNVLEAIVAAQWAGIRTIMLTGSTAPPHSTDVCIAVPSTDTPRIQEAHEFILHTWAEALDQWATS